MFFAPHTSDRLMTLLTIPATYATAFGFMFAYGRQVFAMSRSGLFPTCLSLTYKDRGTPWTALLTCSIIAYIVCLAGWLMAGTWLFKNAQAFGEIVFNMCLFGAFLTYLFQLSAFIILKVRFPQLPREYHNPMGLPGAISTMIIFLMCFIGAVGFSEYVWQPFIGIITWFVLAIAYYFVHARHNSTLSPEEQFAMFMVYSIKIRRKKATEGDQRSQTRSTDSQPFWSTTCQCSRVDDPHDQRHYKNYN